MSHNAEFAPTSSVPQCPSKRHWRAAAIADRPLRPRTLATTILAITAILTVLVLPTTAAPPQGEASSQRGLVVLPLCPAGTHLEPTHLVECLPCTSGVSFMTTANRETECLECLSCPGLIVESPCNATHNTVCRCPPGQYLNVDEGCTTLVPSYGNGTDSSATSSVPVAAAVNHEEEGQSCEKESILTGVKTGLLVLVLAGVVVIIILLIKFNNVNWHYWKCTASSRGRLGQSIELDPSQLLPLNPRDTVLDLSNDTHTDEPTNAQLNAPCCADIRAELDKETAEHARTKEKLDANEERLASYLLSRTAEIAAHDKLREDLTSRFQQVVAEHARTKEKLDAKDAQLASYQFSRTAEIAALDKLREDLTSSVVQVRVAVGERQQENRRATNAANADGLAVTRSERCSDSGQQVENLKYRIMQIAQQSGATNVGCVILREMEEFLNNPSGYSQAFAMEAEDHEAGNSGT